VWSIHRKSIIRLSAPEGGNIRPKGHIRPADVKLQSFGIVYIFDWNVACETQIKDQCGRRKKIVALPWSILPLFITFGLSLSLTHTHTQIFTNARTHLHTLTHTKSLSLFTDIVKLCVTFHGMFVFYFCVEVSKRTGLIAICDTPQNYLIKMTKFIMY
jgi:hypothetical protein